MKKRDPRHLSPEEEELWQKVARTATPLSGRPKKVVEIPADKKAGSKAPPQTEPLQPFKVGSKSAAGPRQHALTPTLSARLDAAPVEMDRKAFQKMKRGKSKPEARLDLHGMIVPDAQSALIEFIFRAQAEGKRLVLVITGKGRTPRDDDPIPTRVGILRHHVPDWLSRPPLKPLVLQVTEAHQRHGGSGAFYVYLRRR